MPYDYDYNVAIKKLIYISNKNSYLLIVRCRSRHNQHQRKLTNP